MPVLAMSSIDDILTTQLNVAWAGENTDDPPRMAWWSVNLSDPLEGGDFTRRLAPRTWAWAALIALREAGRRADEAAIGTERTSDRFASLFRISPRIDERLDDRLTELRSSGKLPHEALPNLLFVLDDGNHGSDFDADQFSLWLDAMPSSESTLTTHGRLLSGDVPADPVLRTNKLANLLSGAPAGSWPFPHARVGE